MKRFFFVDGKMTGFSSALVIVITFGGILGVLYFQPPFWLGGGILAVSLIIGAIGAAAGAAESIGLKPFTNDPSGWRKAKESYNTDKRADEDASKGDTN
jgi:hypothetical protein